MVEGRRVVEPILVEDQRPGHGTQLDEAVPIAAIARQARYLEPEHNPYAPHADLGHQPLKALPIVGAGSRDALVAIDDLDPLGGPTESLGPLA